MSKLNYNDYGFEYNFVAEGEMEDVIEKFSTHTEKVHGIDLLSQSIDANYPKKK